MDELNLRFYLRLKSSGSCGAKTSGGSARLTACRTQAGPRTPDNRAIDRPSKSLDPVAPPSQQYSTEDIIIVYQDRLPQIGEFMKKAINEYFHKQGEEATVKYIDPSYMIRSVPANATDTLYCMQLAQNAVHGTSKCSP
ncbi:hypothetical protein THAOC_28993 [Thalassiosira oceanica]|uniref:Uncharacterized protein n=1 Tax=Thalassiosira oceanica TaxID=159749 RepID=K0RDL1_THAOC|nr:hypothetical protein THAOC_28993 [Thalassiosira oceanica]|eukprot:EJK51803.1 hypothetical protein THAOC_28993 [Thalassiosira oceanica]